MKRKLFLFAAGIVTLAIIQVASACPDSLECSNFTDSDKVRDCNYMTNSLNEGERQYVLCGLWDQTYHFDSYEFPEYELEIDLTTRYNEIDNSSFILAGKILVFGIFNYIIFSLTKLSMVAKWLNALS